MKKVSLIVFAPLFLFLVFWGPGNASSELKIRGKYEVVGDLEDLKGAKSVEMIEFFNYSCGHCYRFLTTVERLHEKYQDRLHHKKYPIYWGNQTPYPARAYYIADRLGMEPAFTQELFDTNFKMNINIFQPRVIRILARDQGIGREMQKGMQDPQIIEKVQQSLALAKKYNANETPTVIINKVLKVTPSISGGNVDVMTDNLDLIFQDILSYNE